MEVAGTEVFEEEHLTLVEDNTIQTDHSSSAFSGNSLDCLLL